jgi:hypothetical protein
MSKTAGVDKLIRWQRITIVVLFIVSMGMTFMAQDARTWQDFWHKEVSYSDAEIGDLERRHDEDQRIIHDLNQRLKQLEQYEPKPVTDDKCVRMTLKVVPGTLTGQIPPVR